jgi:hypothetical protein
MNINTQFKTNTAGHRVKITAPKPTTEATERFLRHVVTHDGQMPTPCRVWVGSARFRVSDELVMTPRRFVLLIAGFELERGVKYKAICGTPGCVSLGHIGW